MRDVMKRDMVKRDMVKRDMVKRDVIWRDVVERVRQNALVESRLTNHDSRLSNV